jgi:hypothetical protein
MPIQYFAGEIEAQVIVSRIKALESPSSPPPPAGEKMVS